MYAKGTPLLSKFFALNPNYPCLTRAENNADHDSKQRDADDVVERGGGDDERVDPLVNTVAAILELKQTRYDNGGRNRRQEQP